MNTTVKPFDDINVRKAVAAGLDRNALRLTRGGELLGDIATHYLPPGMAGFEEAGGMEGPGVDFLAQGRQAEARRSPPSTSRRPATPPASTRAPRRS